ncbi:GntR family transcriptional regulator [Spongiactinospora sp. TRM90649]|uniref:GntR family transcriptional regulator n=1 Tax=Spongiactinospora sp. TRM90649 TaxID=3031114 RepID=UPI0023FA3AB0|nr:GntR family transcriptional regulator [Spongiactinospora sp. TRM90649]MDF5759194.1 GntR family transcriptional regulator [Spongiactinospora sp. TRM90649]
MTERPSIGQKIAADLRAAIQAGELRPGDTIDSERTLVERYNTSKATVRKVIETLKSEGLLISEPGSRIRVRQVRRLDRFGSTRHLTSERPDGTAPLEAEASSQAIRKKTTLIEVTTTRAPGGVAARLQIEPLSPVIVRRHLIHLDGHPAAAAESYFLPEVVAESRIMLPETISGGVHAELARILGTPLTEAVEELVARMPNSAETEYFRLPPGTPVVELIRTIHAGERPVEVTEWLFDASRHRFIYRVPMD